MSLSRTPCLILFLCVILVVYAPTAIAQQWVATYNGPDSLDDVPSGMVVDAASNTYVAGMSAGRLALVKYDADGNEEWVYQVGLPGGHACGGGYDVQVVAALSGTPVINDVGEVYVVGKGSVWAGFECPTNGGVQILQKLAPDGTVLLDLPLAGPDFSDFAPVLKLGPAGSMYVVSKNILIQKYDQSGTLLWEQSHVGPWTSSDRVDLQVDSAGNAYVAGSDQFIDSTGENIVVMKYDTDGNLLWLQRYDYPWVPDDHGVEEAYALRLDPTGNIYVVGLTTAPWNCSDCTVPSTHVLLKYDTNGTLLWDIQPDVQTFGDMGLDGSGNVFLAGLKNHTVWGGDPCSATGGDYAIQRYDPSGTLLWEYIYDSGDSQYDEALALDVDVSGNVFVTGRIRGSNYACWNPGGASDYGTVMLDPDGNLLWERSFAGPASGGTDFGVDIQVDSAGEVYVTGECVGDGTISDYGTLKYHPCSVPLGAFGDMNEDEVLTSADVIYLVGYVFKGGPPPPICAILGDTNGDGPVTSADIIYMVNHIFKGGPAPHDGDPCDHPLVGTCL